MEKLLYEGKAKKIYATEDNNVVCMVFKDEATAFDGTKKGVIESKGVINNRVSCLLFKHLQKNGIETHLVEQIDDREVLVKRLKMIPVEVVVRNIVAGSLAQKLGIEEGTVLSSPVIELYYKDDSLHDPMINDYHAKVMGWASEYELKDMYAQATTINEVLKSLFDSIDIILVDFKMEFGLYEKRVILGDEISPDTCRLWDKNSLEKLDKDRFRRNLGNEKEAYMEVVKRIESILI